MDQKDDDDQRQRANLITLAIIAIIVVGSIWLVIKFKESSALTDCYLSGRTNCASTDVPSQ